MLNVIKDPLVAQVLFARKVETPISMHTNDLSRWNAGPRNLLQQKDVYILKQIYELSAQYKQDEPFLDCTRTLLSHFHYYINLF